MILEIGLILFIVGIMLFSINTLISMIRNLGLKQFILIYYNFIKNNTLLAIAIILVITGIVIVVYEGFSIITSL